MRTYHYRLYPAQEQQVKLWQHANKLNWLYNYFLNQKIEAYKKDKTNISQSDQQKELVLLKQSDEIISEIYSQVLQQVPLRLKNAYSAFFRRVKNKETAGFPKFRSCRDFFGICYPQAGYTIADNIFKTKVYGKISFIQHKKIQGAIKQVSITNKYNRWYINITTDFTDKNINAQSSIAIDVGLKHLVVSTDGTKIVNCTHAKYFDKKISAIQSRRDKLTKGSRKYKFLNKIKQRLHDAKVRKINDFQHKVSKRLARKYDTIFAENLSVKSMSESKITSLNKAIRNAKLAQFLSFLKYKVNNLVLVNPRNTSKTCNSCDKIHTDLKLSNRTISCSCGKIYDRDENAANNIFCLGQAILDHPEYVGSMTIQEALSFRK